MFVMACIAMCCDINCDCDGGSTFRVIIFLGTMFLFFVNYNGLIGCLET